MEQKINSKNIIDKIKQGDIHLKSKGYFRLKMITLIIFIVISIVLSVFVSGLILFTIRASGQASLLGFGPSGFEVFLRLFPWELLIINIIILFILEKFLRSFKFGYRVSILYLFVGLFLLVSLIGFGTDRVGMHDKMMRHNVMKNFGLYGRVEKPLPPPIGKGIYRGIISEISTSSIKIILAKNMTGQSTTTKIVLLPPNFSTKNFSLGDHVFVMAENTDDEYIRAIDIREAIRAKNR